MKQTILIICIAAIVGTGCKENDLTLKFGTTTLQDTTYVLATSAIPTAQSRNVLVEEFTGQSCTNCPAAHTLLDGIVSQPGNAGRVNVVSLYPLPGDKGGPQANPPSGSNYNLTDSDASNIITGIYVSIPGLPSGSVDRVMSSGGLVYFSSDWPSVINAEKAKPDSVNIDIASTYDAVGGKATISVKVTYIDSTSLPENLSVYILEDSVVAYQELANTSIDSTYLFNDILRKVLTSVPAGDVLSAPKNPGRVFLKVYSYTPAAHLPTEPAPKPAHLRVVAFVSCANGGDVHVVQSMQAKLVQ